MCKNLGFFFFFCNFCIKFFTISTDVFFTISTDDVEMVSNLVTMLTTEVCYLKMLLSQIFCVNNFKVVSGCSFDVCPHFSSTILGGEFGLTLLDFTKSPSALIGNKLKFLL